MKFDDFLVTASREQLASRLRTLTEEKRILQSRFDKMERELTEVLAGKIVLTAESASNVIERIAIGALKTTINAHGPITENFIPSAAKRVAGHLRSLFTTYGIRLEHRKPPNV